MSNKDQNCSFQYDYENKCNCCEDDNCGCTYPNNLSHDVSYKENISPNSSQTPQSSKSRVHIASHLNKHLSD